VPSERENLVIDAGEPALVRADHARLERAVLVTRDAERHHPVIGDQRQLAELDYLVSSRAAMTSLAENYVGVPLE
jgi:hypothetical protein